MAELAKYEDSLKLRVLEATINNVKYNVIVELIGLKPILIHDDNRIEKDFTIGKTTTPIADANGIAFGDEAYKKLTNRDRFFIFAVSKSILNNNYIVFVHDDKYKDILVFPLPIDYKWIEVAAKNIYYKGFLFGSAEDLEFDYISSMAEINERTKAIIEKPKAAVSTTCRCISISGLTNLSYDSGGVNTFEKMFGDYNVQSAGRGVSTMVDLGPADAIFTGTLPVNLLKQGGFIYFNYRYAGTKNITALKGKRLYLDLRF